jgi:hypothetical protein
VGVSHQFGDRQINYTARVPYMHTTQGFIEESAWRSEIY